MDSLNILLKSDYFIYLVTFTGVLIMGLFTYMFGYKSTQSDNDDELLSKVETKETKKQKVEKAKKAESKDKKKPKVQIKAPQEVVVEKVEQEVIPAIVAVKKVEQVKASTPKSTPKAGKKGTKAVEEVIVAPVAVTVAPEEDGWTRVTDRKQKKSVVVPEVAQKVVKAEKVDKKESKKVESNNVVAEKVEDDSWTTVTDRRQKKVTETKSESRSEEWSVSGSPQAESKKVKKSKKQDKVVEVAVVVVAAPVEVEKVVVEEEWIPANPKVNKKNKKTSQIAESAKPIETPVVPAPVIKKVAEKPVPVDKLIDSVIESSQVKPETKKSTKKSKPVDVQVPQAIQELIKSQLIAPNSIAAAIIEQFKNDSNNNQIEETKPEPKGVESVPVVQKNSKSTILKTTNLTESMCLIESDGKSNSRTDSNPSSSESLQDLDVGEGWATITSNKKKRAVRREV